MLCLIKGSVLLISLLFTNVYAGTSPFSVSVSLEKHKETDADKHVLKVSLASNSKEEEKYLVKINVPSSEIKVLDLQEAYSGSIKPADSDSFFIDVEPINEGRGQIKVIASGKDWLFDYSVSKDDTGKFLIYVSNTASNVSPDGEGQGLDPTDVGSAIYDNGDDLNSKIVVNDENRNNNLLRYLMFVLSFFILGYLIYKIVKED